MIARSFLARIQAMLSSLLLIAALFWLMHVPSSYAQTAALKWSRPVPISGALGGSRLPTVVAQDGGNVLLFWSYSDQGQDSTIFVSKNENGAWLRPVDVLLGGPRALAQLDARQHVLLLYADGPNLTLGTANVSEATSVHGWENRQTVSSTQGGVFGDFVFNPDGSFDIAWLQGGSKCERCTSIAFQKQGTDNSPELAYRVLSEGETVPQQRIQILRAPSGTLYVMWDQAAQGNAHAGIKLSLSSNDGDKWLEEPRAANFDEGDVRHPLLFLDKENQLVLVFNYGNRDEVYYSVSADDGVTWSPPQAVPGLFANILAQDSDNFAVAMDSAGISHLISPGRASKTQAAPGLYHAAWDGKAWSNLNEIYHEDTFVENPAVAISDGNLLHVSFATRSRSEGDSTGSSQVWYSNAQTDAPAATRVALATFTPTPTTTPQATVTGTATRPPSPTPLADDAGSSSTPDAATVNMQLPVIVGIVPVVVILVGVLIWAALFRRRR